MKKTSKKTGCLGYVIYFFVFIFVFTLFISIAMGAVSILLVIGMIFISVKLIITIVKSIMTGSATTSLNGDGHQYEYKCAKILKKKGFQMVSVTKGSGDQGIDIIAYKNGQKYGIQCKHYSSPVGNHAVQEVFAGAKYYNCDIAVVMTNNTFTKSAKELAESTRVELWSNNKVPFIHGISFEKKEMQKEVEYSEYEAEQSLKKVNELANTINTTINEDIFEKSLSEIKNKLSELSKYEDKIQFLVSKPSEDLERIVKYESLTREKFRERTKESQEFLEDKIREKQEDNERLKSEVDRLKEKISKLKTDYKRFDEAPVYNEPENLYEKKYKRNTLSDYDLERYAIMCNAYVEHKEEMSLYK